MGSTPLYGWPFEGRDDPPAGYARRRAALLAVEQTVASIDARVGLVPTVELFTEDGTWHKPPGLAYVRVRVQADGGGSGGNAATTSGEAAAGAAGGAGEYREAIIPASDLGATEAVQVGQGGAGGSAGDNPGAPGAGSAFGSHVLAEPGEGGSGGDAASVRRTQGGGAGGTGGSGGWGVPGGDGDNARYAAGLHAMAHGGQAHLSGRARPSAGNVSPSAVAGVVFGGGAAGPATSSSSGPAQPGAAGAAGAVIVENHF